MLIQDDWQNCYDLGWKDLIHPQAFSHPAKFSRGLIFRIIEHALTDGLIQPGQTILDPFGGVALGALPCLMNGLNWVGCELESKFVELGRENIDLWNQRFSGMPKWTGQAVLLQGDSRRLAKVVSGAGLVVSSPPYATQVINSDSNGIDWEKAGRPDRTKPSPNRISPGVDGGLKYGSTNGQLGQMKEGDISAVISSPPFAGNSGGRGEASRNGIDSALFDRHSGGMKKGTGSDPANLDHLPQGQPPAAIISSPPYCDQPTKTGKVDESAWSDGRPRPVGASQRESGGYGATLGQLGAMPAGTAVVSSPPFENQNACNDPKYQNGRTQSGGPLYGDYGSTEGQLGVDSGETFWSAARQIVEQCALILPVGGAAIWVCKRYIKSGKIVDFSGQWAQLCEACGFEVVHWHRAMLVKNQGIGQMGIEGGTTSKQTKRVSFFRRLHEKKRPDLAIDWEDVICTRKK
jgi:hypothetical protein